MSLTKHAEMKVLAAKIAPQGGGPLMRTAHRHEFEYEPRPGYLYVRSRMISSRTNDNFDHFPADEIRQAYRTFIGKPVFVNHHNDNHRRARGVIKDAVLHEDVNPDGSEDVWVEGLMEVDAIRFPKLAQAILAGHIDRTSMGTDVQFSVCSVCNNKATSPVEYCKHIPKMKGQKVWRTTASGQKEGVLVYEKCYGLGFFENSLLVEEPADPTAYFLGVDARGLGKAASKTMVSPDDPRLDCRQCLTPGARCFVHGPRSENVQRQILDLARARKNASHKTAEVEPVEVAGLAIVAQDTGRVLMIQRSYADESDPARGTWEFPGGHLDDGEVPAAAAMREFAEEVGCEPPHGDIVGSWRSGGIYQGFVMVVPTEADINLHCSGTERFGNPDDPNGDDLESAAWWLIEDAKANPALRQEVKDGTDWSVFESLAKAAAGSAGKPPFVPGHRVDGVNLPNGKFTSECECGRPFPIRDKAIDAWADRASHAGRGNPDYDEAEVEERERRMHVGPKAPPPPVGRVPDGYKIGEPTAEWEAREHERRRAAALRVARQWGVDEDEIPDGVDILDPDNFGAVFDYDYRKHEACDGSNRINSTNPGTCPTCGHRYNAASLVVPYHADLGHLVGSRKTAATYDYNVSLECGDKVNYVGSSAGQVDTGQTWNCKDHGEVKVTEVGGPGATSKGLGMDTTASRRVAYEDTFAPAKVDTLRDEQCPVCGEQDAYDGDKCQVCNFIKPPDEFGDPNTDTAKATDLRQEQDDTNDKGGDLACDNCGATFQSDPAAKVAVVLDPEKGTDESEEAASVTSKAGDSCPTCGEGTLQPSAAAPVAEGPVADQATEDGFAPAGSGSAPKDDADDSDSEDESDDEDGKDGGKPDFLKKKKPTANRSRVSHVEGGDVDMRPALAALAAQQKQIEDLKQALSFVGEVAGLSGHPRVASLSKSAAAENPAFGGGRDGVNTPGSPAGATVSTEEAATPTAKDDVESVGSTPLTDVTPQATTSLESDEVVLDVQQAGQVDVEQPVAGTDTLGKGERGQAGTNRVETDVRAGTPSDNSAAFRDGGFLGSKDESRTIASLRLARLQVQAGIAAGDDLDLANVIASSDRSDESIQAEIATLDKVVTASAQPQRVARNLVPQGARQAQRMVPSMTSEASAAPESVGSVSGEEMLFE